MDDRLTDLLRRTLAAKAAEISNADEPFTARPTSIAVGSPTEGRTRWPWWVGAAAIVVLIGAAVVVVGRGGSGRGGSVHPAPAEQPSLPAVAVDPTTPESTAAPTSDEEGLADSPAVADNAIGWFLPTYIPDGYVPVRASALRKQSPSVESVVTNEVYARKSADGTIESRVWLSAFRSGGSTGAGASWATVHGFAAEVEADDSLSTVSWYEAGLDIVLRAEMTATDALAIAERTRVTETGVSLDAPPEGFAPIIRSTTDGPPPGAIQIRLGWADPTTANAEISFLAMPNDGLDTIDTLATTVPARRVDVGGTTAMLTQATDGPQGSDPPIGLVQWIGNGFHFMISGPSAEESELIAVAASVRAVTEQDFDAVAAEATEHVLQAPAVDEATFADGLRVSVWTDQGRSLVVSTSNALVCAEIETRHCAWNGSVGASGSDPEQELQIDVVTGTFNVRGVAEMLIWVRGAEQPTIETTGGPTPTIETVRTDLGTFARVPIADDVETVRINHAGGGVGISAAGEVFDPDVG